MRTDLQDTKFIGTCSHVESDSDAMTGAMTGFYTCKNQSYMLLKWQHRVFSGRFYCRRVISIGWIWNEFGRSILIPIGSWKHPE